MKKILIILSLFCYSNHLIAQIMVGEPYYFCALNGSCYNDNDRKVTFEENEYTPDEIIHLTEQFQNIHPKFEVIEPTSMRYNCHGYTHSVYQGGEKLFIQWEEELCNDAFIEVTNEDSLLYGDIAVIRKKDGYSGYDMTSEHSSIVVNKDTLISKWGDGPLTKHYKYDLVNIGGFDNGVAVYTYYRRVANTQINGADVFNGNGTYTFAPDVEIESCTWNVEPAAMFQQSSGSGTIANLSYKSNLSYLAPKAVLTFTFSYSCDNHYTVKKEIDLTLPTSTLSGIIESDSFVIDDAATVTVTGEIRSNVSAKIIIKPGGKLIVDGGKLTSVCETSKWQGIEVWGNDSIPQYPYDGVYSQGFLELKNGATIENAVCAVELWNPLDNHSEGGIVHATDAIFRNNAKAVYALNYTNYNPETNFEVDYNSSFNNCSFVVDSNYMGEELFQRHIDLSNVSGFNLHGCSFSVDKSVPQVSPRPYGIVANNTGLNLSYYIPEGELPLPGGNFTRNSFEGFETGIYVTNSSQYSRTVSVEYSDFLNNAKGLLVQNTGYATISNNNFIIGYDSDCSFGLYLDRVSYFDVEENTFIGNANQGSDNYGVIVRNSASYNDISRNSFNNLLCGNVALGKNYVTGSRVGLTYTCNTNIGNVNDFCIFKEDGIGGVSSHQGSLVDPAGNTFSGSNYHICNDGDNTISYYYQANNNLQRPIASKLYNVSAVGSSNISSCGIGNIPVIDIMSTDDVVTLENAYNTTLAAYNALSQTNSQSMETTEDIEAQLSQLKTEYLNIVGEIVKFYLQQEEKDYEELREWLVKSEDIFADRMVVASFIQEGNYDDAMTYATMLPKIHNLKGEELQDHNDYMKLIDLYIDLHETNRSTNQLTDAELTMVKNMADNGIGTSQMMAESILLAMGAPSLRVPQCLTMPPALIITPQTRGAEVEVECTENKESSISIFPNPANDEINIELTADCHTIEIYDSFGRVMMSQQVNETTGQQVVDISKYPSGLYLVVVKNDNSRYYKRIVKN